MESRFSWFFVVLGACGSVETNPADAPPDGEVQATLDGPTDTPPPTEVGAFVQTGTFLHARAGHATIIHAGRLWVIGGNVCQDCLGDVVHDAAGTTSNVVSAPIDAEGALGAFREEGNLIAVRNFSRAFAASRNGRDYLYVVGGSNSTGPSNTDAFPVAVERAEITPAGLTAFATVSSLVVGRTGAQLIVRGDDVFVLGGSTGGANGFATSVEHAVIDEDGGLGPFSIVSSALGVPSAFHALVEHGDSVFLLGGVTQSSITIPDVQQATLGTTLGDFTVVPPATSKLQAPRAMGVPIVLEDRVFLFGGGDGNLVQAFDTKETASLHPLGGFVAGGAVLDQPRFMAASYRIAKRFCLVGGANTGTTDPTKYLSSIVCAPLL